MVFTSNISRRFMILPFVLISFFSLPYLQASSEAQVYFSETWSAGNYNNWQLNLNNPASDSCSCADDVVRVDTSDHRPGSSDNYAFNVTPAVGSIGCCVNPRNSSPFAIGQNQEVYVSFWVKYSGSCLFDSGAGKQPDIVGNGTRLVIGCPGIFAEDWSIPTPPNCSGSYKCKIIPTLYNESDPNRKSWPNNSITCTAGGSPASMSQNIDTANPYYIERGYWYRFTVYILAKTAGGRYRLWIKKEGEPEREIIDTNRASGCSTYLNTLGSSGNRYTNIRIPFMYNDHGGNGANPGFKYWIDDIYVTSYKLDDSSPVPSPPPPSPPPGDTSAPSAPTGLRILSQ